ncbi:hypothetical protein M6B22_19425 [Jatrophihabitans cynanchi]|uniref:Uncharacterized protein n=1 Tax=Jatrophihabitans cynanchi TaxID=2944128 RepID=A0ABY7JZA1_9ACTN|nr:hypothetical protein [Jatrophihabitans sp. SB3-54]WAX56677.1 hypothetical protein M6B22_19425 [Jatrophihabitans sp. SB3-54]
MESASYGATGGVGTAEAEGLDTAERVAAEYDVVACALGRAANSVAIPTPTRASSPAWAGDQKVTGQ